LRKFKITLKFDPQEIGIAKKFDIQLIDSKGVLIADLDPFLSGWDYRQEWTMNTAGISLSSDITNDHVILFEKTSSDTDFWNNVNSDGNDIRFTDGSNNLLTYYFEDFNLTAQTMSAWVKITETFDSDTNMSGYFYYGNSGASNVENETEETSETTATDELENVNGTISNVQINQDGKIGKAFNFNDSSGYVNLGNNYRPQNNEEYSFNFWFYPKSLGGNNLGRIFDTRDTSVGSNGVALRMDSSNSLSLTVYGSAGGGTSTNAFDLDEWSHVVLTLDSSKNFKIYVNGEEKKSGTYGSIGSTGTLFYIGRNVNNSNASFDGLIDEFAIWDRFLTSDEAKLIYNSESNNLISYLGQEVRNSAPDLNVTSPTLNLNWNETKSITFDILDAENDKLDVNIYYSSSSGARTNLIYADTNLRRVGNNL